MGAVPCSRSCSPERTATEGANMHADPTPRSRRCCSLSRGRLAGAAAQGVRVLVAARAGRGSGRVARWLRRRSRTNASWRLMDRAPTCSRSSSNGSNTRVSPRLSPFDDGYPGALARTRLGAAAPPMLYAAGPVELLGRGGLAIVGSRDVGPEGAEVSEGRGGTCRAEPGASSSRAARGEPIASR